jgi:hypothetical protein
MTEKHDNCGIGDRMSLVLYDADGKVKDIRDTNKTIGGKDNENKE